MIIVIIITPTLHELMKLDFKWGTAMLKYFSTLQMLCLPWNILIYAEYTT